VKDRFYLIITAIAFAALSYGFFASLSYLKLAGYNVSILLLVSVFALVLALTSFSKKNLPQNRNRSLRNQIWNVAFFVLSIVGIIQGPNWGVGPQEIVGLALFNLANLIKYLSQKKNHTH
jgi:hypothetical protein